MFELTSYVGLFLGAFNAAMLLPIQSEAVLVGMLISAQYATSTLPQVATLGNVLGSAVNWGSDAPSSDFATNGGFRRVSATRKSPAVLSSLWARLIASKLGAHYR